jgi:hypothetical protein
MSARSYVARVAVGGSRNSLAKQQDADNDKKHDPADAVASESAVIVTIVITTSGPAEERK